LSGLKNQRRLAASLLKCGKNRVWFDPERIDEISEATTRRDVMRLIRSNAIKASQKKGMSSWRRKQVMAQKAKGRRKGAGSKKGGMETRLARKREWVSRVRALRSLLKELKQKGVINSSTYRRYYTRAKSGDFYSKAQLKQHLKAEGFIKE
jgi:large subunit ribosomal protein L19e